jgi:peptidoglycan lytic transglycosylase F
MDLPTPLLIITRNYGNRFSRLARTAFWSFTCFFLASCDHNSTTHLGFSRLEQIKHEGALHVLTRQGPTTYFEGPEGLSGLEYELIKLFAAHLGVEAHFKIPDSFEEILDKISHGEADIAAAGLTVTEARQQKMRFTTPYQTITEQIIYRSGKKRPKQIADLNRGILEVVKSTSHEDTLLALKSTHPNLEWEINTNLDTESLLLLVNEGLIDYTIADSHQAAILRSFYPRLNIAFDISKPRQLAWAISPSLDDSLYNEIIRFFKKIKSNNTLQNLLEKYYGHSNNLNYVGNCTFRQHIEERLTTFKDYFIEAGKKHAIDWRLLAAIGYQESHWNQDATSPTGVKGLMMLTRGTAKQLGVIDRTDPVQSIRGGARYFKQRLRKISKRVPEPDRTWFALASYNVGFGHLEDARVLTQKRGGNPDKWMDVKENLPLLSKKKWYSQTKHGYARGREPVRYVENVRSYYDLLVWLSDDDPIKKNTLPTKLREIERRNNALNIQVPAL